MKAGVGPPPAINVLLANLGTLGVVGLPSQMPTSSELRFAYELGCDAGADSAVTEVLADRVTRGEQQALAAVALIVRADTSPSRPISSPMDGQQERRRRVDFRFCEKQDNSGHPAQPVSAAPHGTSRTDLDRPV
jgi:hypothetical protein